jgi:general secretion pathway protein F
VPAYAYTGLSASGKTVKGIENAESVGALKSALKRTGIYLTAVTETNAKAAADTGGPGREIDLGRIFDRVSTKEIANVTRLLSTLLIAGVTLPEALTALVDQVESPRFKATLSDLGAKVNEGSSLADAMRSHPSVFDHLYLNMVRAGEASGSLETVLIRLADFKDQEDDLRSKVSTALIYPIVMTIVGTGVVTLLMVKVVPQISQMFEDTGAELPWTTRLLMWVSYTIVDYWWLLGMMAVGIYFAFRAWKNSKGGRAFIDTWMLKFPVLGQLVRKIAVARFARTLSTMLASGVQLLEAMDIVRGLLNNVVLEQVVTEARDNIREGEGVAPALKRSGEFPPLVTHMISVGERSGQLEQMLTDVANTYDREASTAIGRATAVLEPVMIVLMAVVVGFIVFSIMTPILQMNQMVGG